MNYAKPLSSKIFSYNKAKKEFVIEASTLELPPTAQLPTVIFMRSQWTGKVAAFDFDGFIKYNGEIVSWHYECKGQSLGLAVLND